MINILHISDSHFGIDESNNEQNLILKRLVSFAHKNIKEVDICIFSGDISQSGQEWQYEAAFRWLLDLLIKYPECQLFIVPGNHDIDRVLKKRKTNRFAEHRDSCIQSEEKYKKQKLPKHYKYGLDKFIEFHKKIQSDPKLKVISSWDNVFGCAASIEVDNTQIHICGLNTAIMSFDDEDEGKLIADIPTYNGFIEKTNPTTDLIIAVSHHPVVGDSNIERFLIEWNDIKLNELLMQRSGAHLYLHGHLHTQSAITKMMGTGQFLTTLAGGATYISKYPMRFGLYQIDVNASEIEIKTYNYNVQRGEWINDNTKSDRVAAVLPKVLADQNRLRMTESHLYDELNYYISSQDDVSNIIDKIILYYCSSLSSCLKFKDSKSINVDTALLYKEILSAMKEGIRINIFDHDINRWNELINDGDKIGYNTFNYSKDIISYSIAALAEKPFYSLNRIFVLSLSEDIENKESLFRILKILKAINESTCKYDRITTRIFVADELPEHIILRDKLIKLKDVVYVEWESNHFCVFTENIDFKKRQNARDSSSEISTDKTKAEEVLEIYSKIEPISYSIDQFIHKYNGGYNEVYS
ncbi:metallophosphoesterase [Methylomonas sp. ZR1]|uniref:metallophosphoesterase family protein n=1 Tax=Methylomonas sp. ZR1 TaxID=1797072 RepID=UPI00149147C2|nr:metallophosphoesterase [Methylomonas sp. ZR1]NOV29741.1 metallophosphoesterase [Methylomonas sp. ZR1]